MSKRLWTLFAVFVGIVCLAALGTAPAAEKKVGGGDVKYEAKGSKGPVLFSHALEAHKVKCTECHTKIFKMKKEAKMTKDYHVTGKLCGVCHDGKKAFSWAAEGDCAKCHKS